MLEAIGRCASIKDDYSKLLIELEAIFDLENATIIGVGISLDVFRTGEFGPVGSTGCATEDHGEGCWRDAVEGKKIATRKADIYLCSARSERHVRSCWGWSGLHCG